MLDVGCGTGYFGSALAAWGLGVTGLDPDPRALAFARSQPPGIAVVRGTATALPFPDGPEMPMRANHRIHDTVRLIVSNCVINLSPDKSAVLGRAQAPLQAGRGATPRTSAPSVASPPNWRRTRCCMGSVRPVPYTGTTFSTWPATPLPTIRVWWRTAPSPSPVRGPPSRYPPPASTRSPTGGSSCRGLEPNREDYGQSVPYRGTLPRHPSHWTLDKHHRFPTGGTVAVCGNTHRMLSEKRFSPHFDYFGGDGQHRGIFAGCGSSLPFTAGDAGLAVPRTCC